jgi:uncharacterized membrane protein YfcA
MVVVLIGLAAGFYGGLFGVGGGTIIVPCLIWLGYRTKVAAATSLAAIGITAAAGAAFYAWYGEVRVLDAALVGLPAAAGVVLGAALQQRLQNRVLTGLFAVLVGAIGVKLVIG